MGFGPKVYRGEINRLNARVNLAKSFRGIKLEGVKEKTVAGYDAFFQVFLTHSALERFMKVHGIKNVGDLTDLLEPYAPGEVVGEFFELDGKSKLFDFLCKHIDEKGKRTKEGLTSCKRGESTNVAYVSAAIRHIFAHGHLTANADDINPWKVQNACTPVSDFLLRFIDAEFTRKIDDCYERIRPEEAGQQG